MSKVVVTGLGFITSIGNDEPTVLDSLRNLRHGIEVYQPFLDEAAPVSVLGTVKGFDTESNDPEDYTFPERYRIRREEIRSMNPHVLYAHCAVLQALEDAGLSREEISAEETGMYTASGGSPKVTYYSINRMNTSGPYRCSPMSIVASVAGTLSFNLVASFKIKGASAGFVSACASSGHALGYAYDEIKLGRQKRMIVVGAEDGNRESVLSFATMRAVSPNPDPDTASRPFDKKRNGFVGTGGASVLILEDEAYAKARGANIRAEFCGWGHASDGYSVAISHPHGHGVVSAVQRSLSSANMTPADIDYVNAHAPSTQIGDLSEIRGMKTAFGEHKPAVSSTKALTGHGLSLGSAMEAGFSILALEKGFMPGSAHITEIDAEAADLNILRETVDQAPRVVMSNSSGFGGANVSLIFRHPEGA